MKQIWNPFLPLDVCIADGEAHVFHDRVYLFGSHDRPGGSTFCMEDYVFYSAPVDDLTSWTCRGISYSAVQDPLYSEKNRYLYAPDVVCGNDGRYYLYYCLCGYQGPVSVAVCDEPDGKYEFYGYVRYADGTICRDFVPFDPAVINDDGIIRLYYGTWWPFDQMPAVIRPLFQKIEAGMFAKSVKEIRNASNGVMGAVTLTLEDDMITIRNAPKQFLHTDTRGTPFESHTAIPFFADGHGMKGHGFFEASSIRKINDLYYFVWSSANNHELCYAVSRYPDRDFVYGGTIISNGDVGYAGRSEKQRINATGTIHGSIEMIGSQLYVFYHRLTHGSDYSRQMCAEKIETDKAGRIAQVQMTSCGMNEGLLKGKGRYPAAICCGLGNGHMPHTGNRIVRNIPMVTHEANEVFIANAKRHTEIIWRFFDLRETKTVKIIARGQADAVLYSDEKKAGAFEIHSDHWTQYETEISSSEEKCELRIIIEKGKADLLELIFE